jgi:hypothetical protein
MNEGLFKFFMKIKKNFLIFFFTLRVVNKLFLIKNNQGEKFFFFKGFIKIY